MRSAAVLRKSLTLALMLMAAATYPSIGRAQDGAGVQEKPSAPRPSKLERLNVKPGITATTRGSIGGEAHDSYIVHVEAGRDLSLKLRSRGDRAELTVSREEFGAPVDFGAESEKGSLWAGTAPESADYFISIVAHPSASYSLTVKVK